MKWLLFVDLDGTFWDHLNVSSTALPFERVSKFTIRDRNGETLTIKPGVLDFLGWARKNGAIISTCSWNEPDIAISALKTLQVENLFDYQRISPEPRKDLLIMGLISELGEMDENIPEEYVFYLDDRDRHMPEIREHLPRLNFLHMWKVVEGYPAAKHIIASSLRIDE